MNRNLTYSNLGILDYKTAWDLQKQLFDLRLKNEINDTLLLLEHPNTYTFGKSADPKNLIAKDNFIKKNNISTFEIDRGGDITYHGPGQIVGYPILNLTDWYEDTHKYLRALEEVIIKSCSEYKIDSDRKEKFTGVWVNENKIAAIGVKVSRWVTMHGFAFNVNTDLSLFDGIIPCGIKDKSVTSLQEETGSPCNNNEVKSVILKNFVEVFKYSKVEERYPEELIISEAAYK